MTTERRKYERIECEIPAVVVAGGERMSGTVIDISRGGIHLKIDDPITVSGNAEIYFEFSETDTAECAARVQWSSGRGAGLEFLTPDKRFTRFLGDLENLRPVLRIGLIKGVRRAVISFSR